MYNFWFIVSLVILALFVYVNMPKLDPVYKASTLTHIWAICAAGVIIAMPYNKNLTITIAVTLLAFHARSIIDEQC